MVGYCNRELYHPTADYDDEEWEEQEEDNHGVVMMTEVNLIVV